MSTKALEKRVTTWLRVRVIYRISVQLHQLVRIGLLLAVTAHGKRVLTHLQQAHKKTRNKQIYRNKKSHRHKCGHRLEMFNL